MKPDLFRNVYEYAPIGIAVISTEGLLEYANPALYALYGYSPGEVALDVFKITHPDDVPVQRAFQTQLLNGEIDYFQLQKRVYRKDGALIWVDLQVRVVRRADGTGEYLLSYVRDITLEKRQEKELLLKANAIASSKAGILIANMEGIILYVNPAFEHISGYPARDLIGQSSRIFGLPADTMQTLQRTAAQQGKWSGEIEGVNKEGKRIFLEVLVNLITDAEGKPVGRMTSLIDITWLKESREKVEQMNTHLEEKNKALLARECELQRVNQELSVTLQQLHQSQESLEGALKELQDKNMELDQFVYKTSHDLRSPLTTVLGLVDILKRENNEQARHKYVDLIENRVRKLDHFIQSMLEYSKNVRTDVEAEKINFRELITECISEQQSVPHFQRLNIQLHVEEGIDFRTDPFRLKIILNNLISNAIKYQNTALPQSELCIAVISHPDWMELTFTDNGIGISREHQDNIFEMFYRASVQAEGTGLGMYIVQQSVLALKGTIDLQSEEGLGTKVTVRLPDLR